MALVGAGPITYVELEKITDQAHYQRDYQLLADLAGKLGLTVIRSRDVFDELCRRLTTRVDWVLRPTARHHAKLVRIFRRYRTTARTPKTPSPVRRLA